MLKSVSIWKNRYGFNGKEKDDGGEWGNTAYDYGFRIYDPVIARFKSVDPLAKKFPWYSSYQFAGDKPIWAIDLDGLEDYFYQLKLKEDQDGESVLTIQFAEKTDIPFFPDLLEPDRYRLRDLEGIPAGLFEFSFGSEKELLEFANGKTLGQLRELSIEEGERKVRQAALTIMFFQLNDAANAIASSQFGAAEELITDPLVLPPKTIKISKSKYPEAARHIEGAQAAGHSKVGVVDRVGAAARRKEALKGIKTESGKDRDEYPPAVLDTGGKGSSVKHINSKDKYPPGQVR